MDKQQTITKEVRLEGVGLHTGSPTAITFKPAEPNAGLFFTRADLPDCPRVPVDVQHVNFSEKLHTSLTIGDIQVKTVEHALATATGLQIDNMEMAVESNEIPILDGSAKPFCDALVDAGIVQQDAKRDYLELEEPVWMMDSNVELSMHPSSQLEVTFKIDYPHPAVGIKAGSFVISPLVFQNEIAPARTFCFKKDVQQMKQAGLIKGGNLENAIVIDEHGVMNSELRFDDEIVRHKILDLLGDLALLGTSLKGHVLAVRSGHNYNAKFVKKILDVVGAQAVKWPPEVPINIDTIKKILPHRYPFLLVDRLVELSEDYMHAEGIKNVTIDEPFFQGHFPQKPVMPGVLLIEAMAQVGGIVLLSRKEHRKKIAYLLSIEEAKFRKPVIPGDQLRISIDVVKLKKRSGRVVARCKVDGAVAAESIINFALVEED